MGTGGLKVRKGIAALAITVMTAGMCIFGGSTALTAFVSGGETIIPGAGTFAAGAAVYAQEANSAEKMPAEAAQNTKPAGSDKAQTVQYKVKYIDYNTGKKLAKSVTRVGCVGDKPVVPAREIDGYKPRYYSGTMTLSANEADNVIPIYYVKISEAAAGSGSTGNASGSRAGSSGGGSVADPGEMNDLDVPYSETKDGQVLKENDIQRSSKLATGEDAELIASMDDGSDSLDGQSVAAAGGENDGSRSVVSAGGEEILDGAVPLASMPNESADNVRVITDQQSKAEAEKKRTGLSIIVAVALIALLAAFTLNRRQQKGKIV